MQTDTAPGALEDEELEPSEESQDEPEEQAETPPTPPAAPAESPRELELRNRLANQGRELAEAKRLAELQARQVAQLNDQVTQLHTGLTDIQKREAERRQQEREAYLQSLPPAQRQAEEMKGLREELATTQAQIARIAAPPARPTEQPAPPQTQPQNGLTEAQARAREIVREANEEFGIELTSGEVAALPMTAFESEQAFYENVMRIAARKANPQPAEGAADVAGKLDDAKKTQIKENARREAAASPVAPRAAGRSKRPTEEDVRSTVQAYDSRLGPRANIARLKAVRDKLV